MPPLAASVGSHTLKVFSEDPNGGIDGYAPNDSSQSSFTFKIGNSSTLNLNLGDFQLALLFSWDVRDSSGSVIDSSGGYEKEKSYSEIICLPNGCYDLSLYDPPANAIGSFSMTDAQGNVIALGNKLLDTTFNFCVTLPPPIDTTSISEGVREVLNLLVYPNPSANWTVVEFQNAHKIAHTLTLYNATGQVIRKLANITSGQVILEGEELLGGMYYFHLSNESGIVGVGKFIVQ